MAAFHKQWQFWAWIAGALISVGGVVFAAGEMNYSWREHQRSNAVDQARIIELEKRIEYLEHVVQKLWDTSLETRWDVDVIKCDFWTDSTTGECIVSEGWVEDEELIFE